MLVEGEGRKGWPSSTVGSTVSRTWTGRTDSNKRVVFPDTPILHGLTARDAAALARAPLPQILELGNSRISVLQLLESLRRDPTSTSSAYCTSTVSGTSTASTVGSGNTVSSTCTSISKGSYVVVQVVRAAGHTLRGVAVAACSLQQAAALQLHKLHYNNVIL